jgi:hypothetical protein
MRKPLSLKPHQRNTRRRTRSTQRNLT